ncbi:glucoamylase [Jatrophihabitans endophyticus]|uniref:Glucoamylase n=1 Tax=Jatrophihabitans endophyticus TaxID=1206085 RepID=A0A1M5KW07_9ACTN|nr:glucodextranase DOMON-like domain-containing protein [Jatrophihabitans endophyticus]SHG56988.1 glucoamylase [Jatrophihabitans endophyticus]
MAARPASPARRRSLALPLLAATATTAALLAVPAASQAAPAGTAAGAPGSLSRFDLARKDCVGTARNRTSKVWFTVANGVLSDVYEPTIDNTNVHSLQYVVTDGRSFTDLQERDTTYTVRADLTGMACTVTATSSAHHYRLVTTYLADPERDAVVVHTVLQQPRGASYRVYARLDAHVNGNGGGGGPNGGADTGSVRDGVPVVGDTATVSQAANRDYAVPTFMALDSPTLRGASVGYADAASDGLRQLDADHALTPYSAAPDGHVVATAEVTPRHGDITMALGFGRTAADATRTAARTAHRDPRAVAVDYLRGWARYDAGLRRPARGTSLAALRSYWLSANVLKASEDKTFPGAVVASLASPWGQAVSAGDLVGGKPVYFGSYREVFARDLYEAVTGLLASGDLGTARAATRFLFERQQQAAGNMPRNSLLNGRIAPDNGTEQLDETAYPLLMVYLTGLSGDRTLYREHVVPAADFVVARGPSFGLERWEEQSGYSPSTIAAEIAGLTAAATIAHRQGDDAHARVYQAAADEFQRTVKAHTVTTTGPYSDKPYFVRLTKDGNPDAGTTYGLGNGSVQADQRSVVDGGFQELVRLGALPADDADVTNSLHVLDHVIAKQTATGTGYYRYGTDGAGTEDGYGDCWTADPTDCPKDGQPWPTTSSGSGQLWPVLSGERAETAIAQGDYALARSQQSFLLRSTSGVGLVPEQAWGNADLAADPYGTDPTTASIGFAGGKAAGSASPLTWAQAQQVRLVRDLGERRTTDRPDITTARYVRHGAPGDVPVTLTAPTDGQAVAGTTTVTGTTAAGARVDVAVTGLDDGSRAVRSARADSHGAFAVAVPVGFGATTVTVAATTATGTGYAQVGVQGDLVGGTSVLDVTDPANDDDGPGTYQYPTAADFNPGAFDLTRFQVLTKGTTVYLRATLRNLDPTFGSAIGAQLLDVYVGRPGASPTSTAAAFPGRNHTLAQPWSQRVEVQGFAGPVWQDAAGDQVGSVTAVVASASARTITIALPTAAFGAPGPGWTFAVTLHGQDGYSSDQARSLAATPQPYQFGVCAAGGTAPICSVDPGTVAKVVDTLTPAGVSQADELDVSRHPATVAAVTAP